MPARAGDPPPPSLPCHERAAAVQQRMPGVRRFVRRHPAISIGYAVLALGLLPSATWSLVPNAELGRGRTSAPDPRYASQGSSVQRARASHVSARRDHEVEAAVETCAGIGLEVLAQKYGLPEDARRVAQHFAQGYELAYQPQIRRGCLHGLRDGG
jgi:hypothetical protein